MLIPVIKRLLKGFNFNRNCLNNMFARRIALGWSVMGHSLDWGETRLVKIFTRWVLRFKYKSESVISQKDPY